MLNQQGMKAQKKNRIEAVDPDDPPEPDEHWQPKEIVEPGDIPF